jgi:hypothetical protein
MQMNVTENKDNNLCTVFQKNKIHSMLYQVDKVCFLKLLCYQEQSM